jgi:hypothetical protein
MAIQGDILFWREDASLIVGECSHLRRRIELGERTWKVSGTLGDYDIIRGEGNVMLGAVFQVTRNEVKALKSFLSESAAVRVDLPNLYFFFCHGTIQGVECVQGSSWLYSARGLWAVGIHRWVDWNPVGFKADLIEVNAK